MGPRYDHKCPYKKRQRRLERRESEVKKEAEIGVR